MLRQEEEILLLAKSLHSGELGVPSVPKGERPKKDGIMSASLVNNHFLILMTSHLLSLKTQKVDTSTMPIRL